jgi:hypothetical protein
MVLLHQNVHHHPETCRDKKRELKHSLGHQNHTHRHGVACQIRNAYQKKFNFIAD